MNNQNNRRKYEAPCDFNQRSYWPLNRVPDRQDSGKIGIKEAMVGVKADVKSLH